MILGFALLGFLGVPIFEKTGYEHLRDFLASPTAQEAGEELGNTLDELQSELEERERLRRENADEPPVTRTHSE